MAACCASPGYRAGSCRPSSTLRFEMFVLKCLYLNVCWLSAGKRGRLLCQPGIQSAELQAFLDCDNNKYLSWLHHVNANNHLGVSPSVFWLRQIYTFSDTTNIHVFRYDKYTRLQIRQIYTFSHATNIHVFTCNKYTRFHIQQIYSFSDTTNIHIFRYDKYTRFQIPFFLYIKFNGPVSNDGLGTHFPVASSGKVSGCSRDRYH